MYEGTMHPAGLTATAATQAELKLAARVGTNGAASLHEYFPDDPDRRTGQREKPKNYNLDATLVPVHPSPPAKPLFTRVLQNVDCRLSTAETNAVPRERVANQGTAPVGGE